jgi:hypothetical protein
MVEKHTGNRMENTQEIVWKSYGKHTGNRTQDLIYSSDDDLKNKYADLEVVSDVFLVSTKLSDAEEGSCSVAVLDSGASAHCFKDRMWFVCIFWNRTVKISGVGGVVPQLGYIGKVRGNMLGVKYAIYFQYVSRNLLSVSRLCDETGERVVFAPGKTCMVGGKSTRFDGKFSVVDMVFTEKERSGGPSWVETEEVDFSPPGEMNVLEEKEGVGIFKVSIVDHWRNCHFSMPGGILECLCHQCSEQKKQGPAVGAARAGHLVSTKFYQNLHVDFVGPLPESLRGNKWLFNAICDYSDWGASEGVAHRDENVLALRKIVESVGTKPESIRSDNGAEFKGEKSEWRQELRRMQCIPRFTCPYSPFQNGKCERFNGSHMSAVRTNLSGVDVRCWDWCAGHVVHVWNRVRRKGKEKSPFEIRNGRAASTKHFRRFGCLAYSRNHVPENKLSSPYQVAIMLGYARLSSAYLLGLWRKDDRCRSGERFVVVEQRDAKFCENVLISNVDDLKTSLKFVNHASTAALGGLSFEESDGSVRGPCKPIVCDLGSGSTVSPVKEPSVLEENKPTESVVLEEDHGRELALDAAEANTEPEWPSGPREAQNDVEHEAQEVLPLQEPVPEAAKEEVVSSTPPPPSKKRPSPVLKDPLRVEEICDDGAVVVKQKRGRPLGSKDTKPRKLRKVKSGSGKNTEESILMAKLDLEAQEARLEMDRELDDGETVECYTVQITQSEALYGPDSIKWIESDTLERTQLEARNCWRPVLDGEVDDKTEIIPIVCIYTRKRCGKFKCRAVALGNRQKNVLSGEVYSPTISHAGNRFLLIESAARGHHLIQFDISNAFIQSTLEEKVVCLLPKHWTPEGNHRSRLVRLLKSLYGLRVAPRRWFDCYRRKLEEDGWEMAPREPGLFKKSVNGVELLLAVYVDDTLISCGSKSVLESETKRILGFFEGKIISPEMAPDGKTEIRDLLGATLMYNREDRRMEIGAGSAIDTILKKFRMENCKVLLVPVVKNQTRGKDADEPDLNFPIRSLVGSLQYVAGLCRPDTSFAVGKVAQYVSQPTRGVVSDAKRILAYLKGTKQQGISYSPEEERNFMEVYGKIAEKAGKSIGNTVGFADADYAGCTVTFKSTSGCILYHRGCPVVWSAKRQSIRATSTCESEYCALYDLLRITQSQGYLDWFLDQGTLPTLFSDNQSALALAGTSVTTKRSKHMEVRLHTLRDFAKDLCYVPTEINKADPLTKPVPAEKYIGMYRTRLEDLEEVPIEECHILDMDLDFVPY